MARKGRITPYIRSIELKFICDMPVAVSTSEWLKTQGHDSIHAKTAGLQTADDSEIVNKAKQEERTIITCDLDFGDIMAASGDICPSVVIFRLEDNTPSHVNQRLEKVLEESSASLEKGAIIIVEESRHRIRLLPI